MSRTSKRLADLITYCMEKNLAFNLGFSPMNDGLTLRIGGKYYIDGSTGKEAIYPTIFHAVAAGLNILKKMSKKR